MRKTLVVLGGVMLAALLVHFFRYEMSGNSRGVVYVLDRLTGDLKFCRPDMCEIVKWTSTRTSAASKKKRKPGPSPHFIPVK